MQSAIATYNQNYNALPGDDSAAKARFNVSNEGGGNGVIGDATLTSSFLGTAIITDGNGAAESRLVWSHLRAAGLVKGAGDNFDPPSNSFGGKIGVQNGAFSSNGFSLSTNVLCLSGISGDAAVIIDERQDDGNALTGNVRAGLSITGAATAYSNNNTYILCTKL